METPADAQPKNAIVDVAVDSDGNVYSTGRFKGTVDFDPGPGTANLTSTIHSRMDIFISASDAQGNLLWAKNMGGEYDYAHGDGIAVDSEGNIYAVGGYSGTVDFDPGPDIANMTASADSEAFVVVLDNGGNFLWARSTSGGAGYTHNGIAVDADGNVYTTGKFYSIAPPTDFDPGPGTTNLTGNGGTDIYVWALTKNGDFLWAKNMGGPTDDFGYDIAVDGVGNVYTTGCFGAQSEKADFDPGPGTATLTSTGGCDIFVSALNNDGNYLWAKNMEGDYVDAYGITVDSSGNVYSTGGDFVAALDGGGTRRWTRRFAGAVGHDIAVDSTGNVYSTGSFRDAVDFDPGPGAAILTTEASWSDDIFVSALDGQGNFRWAKSLGGSSRDEGIAVDGEGNVYTIGTFSGSVDFDPGPGTVERTSEGNSNVFVSKLIQPVLFGGGFTLTNAELNLVTTTGRIVVGDTTTGTVTINAPIDLTGSSSRLEVNSNDVTSMIRVTNTIGTDVTVAEVTLNGNVAPGGTSPSVMSIAGNTTVAAGSAINVQLGGTAPGNTATDHDQLQAAGTVDIEADVTLATTAFGSFLPAPGQQFVIIRRTGGTGIFDGLPDGAVLTNFLGSGLNFTITYTGGDGDDVMISHNSLSVVDVQLNAGLIDPAPLPSGPLTTTWSDQRSTVRNIQITFSQNVVASTVQVTLTGLGVNAPDDPDQVITLEADDIITVGNVTTLDLSEIVVPDGVFQLEIAPTATSESGLALDGNGDGTVGDAYRRVGAADNRFFKLTADFNGDGGVTIFDFPAFAYWFGQSVPTAPEYMDLDLDGGISIFDFPEFASQFGVGVTFPVTLVSRGSFEPALLLPERHEPIRQNNKASRVLDHPLDRQFAAVALPIVEHWTPVGELKIQRADTELPDLEEVLDEIGADVFSAWSRPWMA